MQVTFYSIYGGGN